MKYFLSRDSDCHWYLVEAERRNSWDAWCEIDTNDPASWEVPAFARAIDSPSDIEFEFDLSDL